MKHFKIINESDRVEFFSKSQTMRSIIHDEIKSFNKDVSPAHVEARKTGPIPLELYLYNSTELVGGLVGDTYWGWLDIYDLWLIEKIRNEGLGKKTNRAC